MSKKACIEFFVNINTNNTLQQAYANAIKGKEDWELMEVAHSVVQVGTKYGYDFTPQDYVELLNEIEKWENGDGDEDDGELSDEILELVAGGICAIIKGSKRCS
ncbi:hypothetical protein GTQ43_25475 [Nostoc sp. KVJ3]|uniref:hypothetical protein n=1 Tax=Nostoc sp. KVJ3 TaxID=457945 RepID=UPI002237B1AF|nr:hypothetical protein [Nostoc sp. KVJ3]MCW5317047.1 hypothetical protein [Nostoc sp. KVJ3]